MSHQTLTDQTYKQQVSQSKVPFIIDFWAPWCHPCKAVDPILEELSKEYGDRIVVATINADENPQAVSELNVMSMPTVIVFSGGQPVKALVGAHGKEAYQQMIEEALAS